jgi:response regulator RpfG family c-di-GMP phosphodiesterase
MRKINILIADDEEMLRDVVEMILESEIDANYIKAANGEEAINHLEKNPDIDFILSDFTMPKKNGGDVYLKNCELKNLPFILMSGGFLEDYPKFKDFTTQNSLNCFIEKPCNQDILINQVKKIIATLTASKNDLDSNSVATNTNPKTNEPLFKIKLEHFIRYAKNTDDIFISLAPGKFVKISDEQNAQASSLDILKHYQSKNVEYIYIKEKSLRELVELYKQNIVQYKTPSESIQIAGKIFHLSVSCLEALGVSELNMQMTNEVIDETIKELSKANAVGDCFKKICDSEGYLVGHSLIIMYLAGNLIKKSNLPFNTTMKKICTAAFVHDMSLGDDSVAQTEQNPELLTERKDRERILNHPQESSKLIMDMKEIIDETKKIILEHHEKPDGSGYPRGINATQISSLSSLFNICHDIALAMIKNDYDAAKVKIFLEDRKEYYHVGNYANFYEQAIKSLQV